MVRRIGRERQKEEGGAPSINMINHSNNIHIHVHYVIIIPYTMLVMSLSHLSLFDTLYTQHAGKDDRLIIILLSML